MPTINHLQRHLSAYGTDRNLFTAAFMIFFFVTFDGTLMYLAPILMTDSGLSEGTMGLVIGLSSVAGLLFDVILGRLFAKASYRLMFLCMLLVAASYPFFLFGANTITVYLIAMAIWGLYYNLYNMGTIDFVENTASPRRFASSFGVLKVFDGLGNLIAPFIGSLLVLAALPRLQMMEWPIILIVIAFVFFFLLLSGTRVRARKKHGDPALHIGVLKQLKLWNEIGHILLPMFLLTVAINLVDSAIWTIGPIFSESLGHGGGVGGGAFMIAYTLPPLLVGWAVGYFVSRYGKKNTAIVGMFLGSLFVSLIGVVSTPLILVGIMFATSFCFSLAWPSINAAYADYIRKDHAFSKDIEAVEDWFTNLGDTLGPILGGYAAEFLGNAHAFAAIGLFGVLAAVLLFRFTPERMTAKIRL